MIWLFVVNNPLPASTTTASEESPNPYLPRVNLADAKAAYDSKSAVFVDVRDADSYATKHIQGAINLPLGTLENQTNNLNPNQWIITYCTWPAEESSARGAQILINAGFKKVNSILGGFAAWEKAGYPTQP